MGISGFDQDSRLGWDGIGDCAASRAKDGQSVREGFRIGHAIAFIVRSENERIGLAIDAIKRFGRFPHRNTILGRKSTPEEIAYLEDGGFSG